MVRVGVVGVVGVEAENCGVIGGEEATMSRHVLLRIAASSIVQATTNDEKQFASTVKRVEDISVAYLGERR